MEELKNDIKNGAPALYLADIAEYQDASGTFCIVLATRCIHLRKRRL